MSLVLSGIALAIGLAVSVSSLSGAATAGVQPIGAASTTFAAESGSMRILWVPQASTTTCTASGANPGAVQTAKTSGSAPMGPHGEVYEQRLGIIAFESTDVTVTCDGADAALMGPIDPYRVIVPIGLGLLIGTVLGILGLLLAIVGIVRLVRSRRA